MKCTSRLLIVLLAAVTSGGVYGSKGPVTFAPSPVFTMESSPERRLNATAQDLAFGMEAALVGAEFVTIDLDALQPRRSRKVGSIALSADRGVPGQSFLVQLLGRTGSDMFTIDRVETDGDIRSLIGHVHGEQDSSFTMTMQGKSVLAKIHLSPYLYVIEDRPSLGGHVMKQIDKRRIPAIAYKDDTLTALRTATNQDKLETGKTDETAKAGVKIGLKSLPDNGNVRVLFLYTPDVQSANNISTLTANIVSEFNSTLANSNVAPDYYLTRAGTQLVNDNFDHECRATILGYMSTGSGVFSNLDTQMANVDADIAFLLITTEAPDPSECWQNVGRIGGVAYIFVQGSPYGLSTDTWALGDLSAIHETGHILGGHHANETDPKPTGVPADAEGWAINDADPFQTIMGGYQVCAVDVQDPPQSQDCERIAYWSDPFRFINGDWIGDSDSNMTDSLPDTSSGDGTMGEDGAGSVVGVAGWDSYSDSRPSKPSNLTAQNEWCYGLHEVSWPSVSDTQQYQLLRSTSSSFTNPAMIYNGSNTSTFITVNSGTWYLRVRACNGSGCSLNSVQRSATYYPSCL